MLSILMVRARLLSLFFSLILATGCGYRFTIPSSEDSGVSLSIPYVQGDRDGRLTAALARQLLRTTSFDYRVTGGRLNLCLTILDNDHDYIGFRYEQRDETGDLINRLTPDEERRTVRASVSVIDTWTHETIYGPAKVEMTADYDYVDSDSLNDLTFIDRDGIRRSVLQFSLGQLDAFEDAREISLGPLYERLAGCIAAGISHLSHYDIKR